MFQTLSGKVADCMQQLDFEDPEQPRKETIAFIRTANRIWDCEHSLCLAWWKLGLMSLAIADLNVRSVTPRSHDTRPYKTPNGERSFNLTADYAN